MNFAWKCDERSGCVAVYPADEHYECLSGAHKWAIYFAGGNQKKNLLWEMDEEEIAKARLIAAAPELLRAAEQARRELRILTKKSEAMPGALYTLNKAIKKAKEGGK